MGKKSKKNAGGGSKGKGSVSTETNGGATTYFYGTGGCGILTSGGGTSSKKQRCVLCCALLKDLAKAHACPGCSLLFCWRCERKSFASFPNGDRCVRPVVRCESCRLGVTMERELVAAGALGPNEKMTIMDHWAPTTRKAYREIVESRADLTGDSWPYVVCGAAGCMSYSDKSFDEMLALMECIHCASASANKLLSCWRCKKIRCDACFRLSEEISCIAYSALMGKESDREELSTSAIAAFGDCFKLHCSDKLASCLSCSRHFCFECVNSSELERSAKGFWALETGHSHPGNSFSFQCSTCYWAAKPCTNPNCPNEVGVQTKRCGGCHIDRYCSVECQAIMYSDHRERCQKIQEKRATAGKSVPIGK